MIEEKSNQQMIDSKTHQHMKCDINRNQIKQHMIEKTPIENKIPIKTKRYQLGEKIPRRG